MGIRQVLRKTRSAGSVNDVPKGHIAVYVGTNMRRFIVPMKYLNLPGFRNLLNQAEEEFEFYYPTGGLTIPCSENEFLELISSLS